MILDFVKLVNGSSLSLPAHGRAGARATFLMAAHFAKQKTKFGGGKALLRLSASDGQARAGPEEETSFPYGVNKNSCFLLAP